MSMQSSIAAFVRTKALIGGQWVTADDDRAIDVFNPADGAVLGSVPRMGRTETVRAIEAARRAHVDWRARTAKQRADLLHRWFGLIQRSEEGLARLLTAEQGKPIAEARAEIRYAASFIEWFAEEGKRVYGDIIPAPEPGKRLLVLKQPVGVVAAITPWNFPAAMVTRKLGPALASGCCVVLKPASETPFSALALAALAEEAGIPAGVLNVVTGSAVDIAAEFAENPTVRKITFTGSTAVGKKLMAAAAGKVKRLSLELGGNAPFIVFDDANLDAAVEGTLQSKFRNSGQTCVSANRILVQDGIYESFVEKLTARVRSMRLGSGFDESSEVGPLISAAAIQKVTEHVADALSKGATVTTGGQPASIGATFFEPTVLRDASAAMLLAREETFGPVAPVFRFHSEAEAIALANATEFGLASYFYTRDVSRLFRVAEALDCGIVGANSGLVSTEVAPFGGIKESGMGREGSKYGIEDYLDVKYLCIGNVG